MLVLVALLACKPVAPTASPEPGARWLKGQLHAHSGRSGDSKTPPDRVASWYAEHGFDFVVMTDHNAAATASLTPLVVIPGMEITQNLRAEDCAPAPLPGGFCPIHVNALFADGSALRLREAKEQPAPRLDRYLAAIEATRAMGASAQINHPNYEWAVDAGLLGALADGGAKFVEIANLSGANDEGDAEHPSSVALWDKALVEGHPVWGTATDDAHHYDDAAEVRASGEAAYVGGLGWVMVLAQPDPRSIREALEAGRFYASAGPVLSEVTVEDGALAVRSAAPLRFVVVKDGVVTREVEGVEASEPIPAQGYVRIEAIGADGARAWTQPAFARP